MKALVPSASSAYRSVLRSPDVDASFCLPSAAPLLPFKFSSSIRDLLVHAVLPNLDHVSVAPRVALRASVSKTTDGPNGGDVDPTCPPRFRPQRRCRTRGSRGGRSSRGSSSPVVTSTLCRGVEAEHATTVCVARRSGCSWSAAGVGRCGAKRHRRPLVKILHAVVAVNSNMRCGRHDSGGLDFREATVVGLAQCHEHSVGLAKTLALLL